MKPRRSQFTTPVAHLIGPGQIKCLNDQIAYKPQGEPPTRLVTDNLEEIICYGDISITAEALQKLYNHKISTAWLSPAGHRCRGRLVATDAPSTLTRMRQHQAFHNPQACCVWAKLVVRSKLQAYYNLARHYQRHGHQLAGKCLAALSQILHSLHQADTLDKIRGYEGGVPLPGSIFMPPSFLHRGPFLGASSVLPLTLLMPY
ncbi:MAG: hypothetical protein KatS3mg113_0633 [Planctomycetaceae bacterium]|nr:MAG: hypothetical protein KatS3mg113_0633 [Planctomycetaceae bacterium]